MVKVFDFDNIPIEHSSGLQQQLKFMFSKKATKIDEILTIDLKSTKGQLISRQNFRAITSSKKTNKTHSG